MIWHSEHHQIVSLYLFKVILAKQICHQKTKIPSNPSKISIISTRWSGNNNNKQLSLLSMNRREGEFY